MEQVRREHADDGEAAHRVNPSAAAAAVLAGPRQDAAAEEFQQHRTLLFGLAYRLLGSVHDAEDAVQDAYLRWASQDPDTIGNPAAFLTTVVTRLCLDRLRSAAARRELYVGPWLPEPLPTGPQDTRYTGGGRGSDPAAAAALRDSASIGMLLLLERLNPAERAVFVLREAFDLPYPRIAEIIDHSIESCRQLHRRAGQRVAAPPGRARASMRRPQDPARDRRIVEGFLAAAQGGDLDGLAALFREDVVVLNDGGGRISAARRPIVGAQKAARLYARVIPRRFRAGEFSHTSYNHQPALLARLPILDFVYVFDIDDAGLIAHLYMIANPDKLTHLAPCAARPPAP
jgi:RNA polymerase sigma-70 factor (ECF subfamily)